MRNKRGAIKVKTIVEFILILIIILFGILIFDGGKEDNNILKLTLDENNQLLNSNKDIFSVKFLQLVNNKKNIIYSPLSIKYALKILQEGASSNTYEQIQSVLGDNIIPECNNIDNIISFANGLFVRDSYSKFIKKEYIDNISKYNIEIKYDPFENANNINQWIQEKTFGLIQNILDDSLIQNSNKKMMLLNSLAINMEWKKPFSFEKTTGQAFTLNDGTEIMATTMEQDLKTADASYYIEKDLTALTMDLKETENIKLEFLAIMPNMELDQYINQLTDEKINYISNELVSANKTRNGIKIQIPKFSFDYNLNLKDDLKNVGITDMFDEKTADFSKMVDFQTKLDNLYIEEILHKSKIDFSEKGVKSTAITTYGIDTNFFTSQSKQEIVKINKPFIFFIRNKETKEIWFSGAVYEPNLWDEDMKYYNTDIY